MNTTSASHVERQLHVESVGFFQEIRVESLRNDAKEFTTVGQHDIPNRTAMAQKDGTFMPLCSSLAENIFGDCSLSRCFGDAVVHAWVVTCSFDPQ